MTPDDRRPFRGPSFDRGRNDRPVPPGADRGDRPPLDRPGFGAPRPFVRAPTRGGDMPPPDHRVHLRDGDREIEVSGNPAFVRQVLDDLPTLMARLRGEVPGRTTISMPAPPAVPAIDAPEPAAQLLSTQTPADLPAAGENEPPARNGNGTGVRRGARKRVDGAPSVEAQVFEVLRGSTRPLPIAAIRERMDADVSGQLVRRLLERASDRVTVSADRPATYSLR